MDQPTKDHTTKELKSASEKMLKTITDLKGTIREIRTENTKLQQLIITQLLEQTK